MERGVTVKGKSIETGDIVTGIGIKWVNNETIIITNDCEVSVIPSSLRIINFPSKEEFKKEVLSDKQIYELHENLVQTTIDYLKKFDTIDVDGVSFYVDGLKESIDKGTWTPFTDSSLSLYGYEDGINKIIGFSM